MLLGAVANKILGLASLELAAESALVLPDLPQPGRVALHELEGRVPSVDLVATRASDQIRLPVPEKRALQGPVLPNRVLHKLVHGPVHLISFLCLVHALDALAELLEKKRLAELLLGLADVGQYPRLLEGVLRAAPGVRPDVDGREIDGLWKVVSPEVLTHVLGPFRGVLPLVLRSRRPESLLPDGHHMVRVQLLHKSGLRLDPALKLVVAVWDQPCLAPGLVDQVPGQDGRVVPVHVAVVHVRPVHQRAYVVPVDLSGSLVRVKQAVPLHNVVLLPRSQRPLVVITSLEQGSGQGHGAVRRRLTPVQHLIHAARVLPIVHKAENHADAVLVGLAQQEVQSLQALLVVPAMGLHHGVARVDGVGPGPHHVQAALGGGLELLGQGRLAVHAPVGLNSGHPGDVPRVPPGQEEGLADRGP
mmetsp:Transcript_334/g.1355  ORF Transcript_334/g.1355 Transcript_334/m.1355 type:complete len:418 (-) Transcript_334:408-1661(-)